MSYEPSHRKPPRQERWPNATPGEGWPAYQRGDEGRAWEPAEAYAGSRNGHGTASNGHGGGGRGSEAGGYGDAWGGGRGQTAAGYGDGWGGARYSDPGQGYRADGNGYGGTTTAYPAAGDGYAGDGYADGFDGAVDGYRGGYRGAAERYGAADGYDAAERYGAADGYGGAERYGAADGYGAAEDYGAADGYGAAEDYYETPDGWDGYTQPGHEFTGSAGYLAQDEYPALDHASSVLVAPDTTGEWWRQPDDDGAGDRGLVVGAVTGLLAAAVAIGVATLAAAFVGPQASPVTVVGGVLIGQLPASLRNHLMVHFGAHAQTLLLLGAIGLLAIVLGAAARRNTSAAVAGLAAFGLLGAFVAITRPQSRVSDVIPPLAGVLAGIVALLWLARASAPAHEAASSRPAYGGGRRAR